MKASKIYSSQELHFLNLLAREFPTVQAAGTEIINLQAILNLPKGCEHFISDVHGEHEAFRHLINACSGVIRSRIDELFGDTVSLAERNQLATLIYYPKEKIKRILPTLENPAEWYRITLHRLVELARSSSARYTRSKVRKSLNPDYAYIIEELLHTHSQEVDKHDYFENIIATVIEIDQADGLIEALSSLIKRMVDQLHLVGDIFDRGPRADKILDDLMAYHRVDIEWGNHDILWMGAASGSRTLVATVLSNSIHYNNLEVVETGYGISLRPLSVFANEVYKDCDVSCFKVKLTGEDKEQFSEKDKLLSARMHKAITLILFKLEGQKILRHPEYGMEDRLLLDKIDYENKCITIGGTTWPLKDTDFPTVNPADPYTLTPEEDSVIRQLTASFLHSEKLQAHVRFLYSKGSFYKICNGNLIFHGCVPMTPAGDLMTFTGSPDKERCMDFLWFLCAGRNSPLFGKDRMATFERRLIEDEAAWAEPKNAYYKLYEKKEICEFILEEFGLSGAHCHIINGHVPVKTGKGESPVKGGGKLIVIDGGFCKAYQPTSGIAGYTLVFNAEHYRIVSHQPFAGKEKALEENSDIDCAPVVFERMEQKLKIKDTDIGRELEAQIKDLKALLQAFKDGAVKENHGKK